MSGPDEVDIVVVGAGAAGLSLAYRLAGQGGSTVALVEPPEGPLRPAPRTWCFWEAAAGEYDAAVSAAWGNISVHGPDGRVLSRPLGGLRYKMIRSGDFERLLSARRGVRRVAATVTEVRDGADGAQVHGVDGGGRPLGLRARWVFDSRPLPALPPARSALLQHFRGWFLRAGRDVFDPRTAELMDFRTPQPAHGLSFGYVLPFSGHEALVEYTEFSGRPLTAGAYDDALHHYVHDVLGLGAVEVLDAEQGVIPMTDAVFPRRAGRSVFRIGTAGGATRPATGYTFTAIQRQSRLIARLHREGSPPVPPAPHPARHLVMDAVMLRALTTGRVDGAEFFTELFRRNPVDRLLRFMDGTSRPREDLAMGLRTPVRPMLRSAVELPLLRRRGAALHD